jgi:hypothetical protein
LYTRENPTSELNTIMGMRRSGENEPRITVMTTAAAVCPEGKLKVSGGAILFVMKAIASKGLTRRIVFFRIL